MIQNISNILFAFCFFSILGWIIEVVYRSTRERHFVNPGLLKGPYLILYGTAALILMGVISLVNESNLLVKILIYFAATTGLELISGLISTGLFNNRLWDYSDQRFQYRGHICLKFSICWVIFAFIFEYLMIPAYQNLLNWLSPSIEGIFTGVALSFIVLDFLAILIERSFRTTPEEKTRIENEFMNSARPLLENPMVIRLSQHKHHRGKTRLEHVKEVSWISFLLGKRLSLDCKAIIRGALLHDLFFYDWLHEGPRLHGFRHHNIALKNARKITSLSKKEEDIIKKHMWPLTIIPPFYMESLIVSLIDTFCSARDYISFKKCKGTGKPISVLGGKRV